MVEMLSQHPPWSECNVEQWVFKISQKAPPDYKLQSEISEAARHFLSSTFNYNQYRRPTADMLLKHHWFRTGSTETAYGKSCHILKFFIYLSDKKKSNRY